MSIVSNAASQRSISDFFYHPADKPIGPMPGLEYGYIRPELHDEWLEYLHEQERSAYAADLAASKKESNTVKLPPDKVNELASKYNPRQMSRDEFKAFLREMVDLGVIKEDDYNLMGEGYAPLYSPVDVCSLRSGNLYDSPYYVPGRGMPMNYDQSGGDILAWFSMESVFHSYDPYTHTKYLGNRDRSFGRVYCVLEQMYQQSPASKINYQQSQQTHQTSRLLFDLKNSRIAAPVTAARR